MNSTDMIKSSTIQSEFIAVYDFFFSSLISIRFLFIFGNLNLWAPTNAFQLNHLYMNRFIFSFIYLFFFVSHNTFRFFLFFTYSKQQQKWFLWHIPYNVVKAMNKTLKDGFVNQSNNGKQWKSNLLFYRIPFEVWLLRKCSPFSSFRCNAYKFIFTIHTDHLMKQWNINMKFIHSYSYQCHFH